VSRSAAPPEFFIDRSLGRYHLANSLRACGFVVRTMAEVYGERFGHLRAAQQSERYVANLPAIVRRAEQPGPYIYGVYAHGLRRIWPRPRSAIQPA
jgi:hypothetical protein